MSGDPDRRRRLLERSRSRGQVVHAKVLARKADVIFSPQSLDQGDRFFETRNPLFSLHPKAVELALAITKGDAEDKFAFTEKVEDGNLFSDDHRMMKRQ